ncbi:prolactin-3D1 isoform X1 [Peromyscus maniculatus bairdii]|uniref:Prolactin family 3 subfamily d member 1 n=3 Tax=Peromyscus TaxID=10040 RepID=D0VBK2_PERMB|nr:prolactin-3D1-like [Peromyscus maniculatus bairdii]ACY09628.1 prolactin family 3 subfamily d member 1 [Peromyscus maniculatus bairdii]ACY09630.1 prolactin family 3 subfamily d member 1 [Peromyscus polionotus subgriseus]
MPLALTLPSSAGVCMLLMVSNLLLWEHVSSKPTGSVSTEALYYRAFIQSHATYFLAGDLYHEFEMNYFNTSWIKNWRLSLCHTDSIHTPQSHEEFHETKTEDLLKAMITMSHAWEEPLKHLISAVPTLKESSDKMLQRTNALRNRTLVLQERMKIILTRSQNEFEKDPYPAWSGLADLQSSDEDTRLFAFYSLLRCLKRDTHKMDTYLMMLRCRELFKTECFHD